MPDWRTDIAARLSGLALTPAREAEIIEELSQDLDDRYDELRRSGRSDAEARALLLDDLSEDERLGREMRPLRQASTPEAITPGAPRGRLTSDLWQDLRYAARLLRKQRGFATAAVLTLALGIGANTAIFSLVNATLLQRLPVRESERLVYVGNAGSVFSYPGYLALRDGHHVFDGLAAWGGITASLNADGTTDLVTGAIVTGNFFEVLGVPAERGRLLSTSDDVTVGGHPVAVISHRLWVTRFGRRNDIVNRDVLLNGHVFTVVGVTPPAFTGAQLGIVRNFYVPMMMQAVMRPPRAGYYGDMNPDLLKDQRSWLNSVGRLKRGLAPEQATAELSILATNFVRSVDPAAPARRIGVVPVDIGDPAQRRQMRSVATLLGCVVGAVLLIACANVANLLLSRSVARQRELALRMAIGASRWRIVRQLLTESVLLSLAGGAVGVGLAYALVRGFRAAPPPAGALPMAIDFSIDGRVLVFSCLLAAATGVIFGLLPAIRASRPGLVPALKDASFAPDGHARRYGVKQMLVVAEVALSLALLIAAGLFVRSLRASQAIDPGIDTAKVLSAPLNINLLRYTRAQGREFYQHAVERMQALPGVESAALARVAVLTRGARTLSINVEGRNGSDNVFRSEGGGPATAASLESINANVVSPAFFETLGIALVGGRPFSGGDVEGAPRVVLFNETAAKIHFPDGGAIGRRVSFDGPRGPWAEIVGVTGNSDYGSLGEAPRPVVYFPLAQNHETGMTLYVRARVDPASLAGSVRREIQALDPNLPVPDIQTMTETIGASLYAATMGATLLTAFGALALLLSAIGVYGVLAFSIAQRTREMGIRVALGADARSVFALVVREGMSLVGIGIVLGLAMAAIGARWLAAFLYGVGSRDALTFASVTIALAIVALVACVVPARRAMRVEPMAALRTD